VTLFTVSGAVGALIVVATMLVWLAGLIDSAGRERYRWTLAILVLNFPAAIAWFVMRSEPAVTSKPHGWRRAAPLEQAPESPTTYDGATEETRRDQLRGLARRPRRDTSS
jgi:hypothetical protein